MSRPSGSSCSGDRRARGIAGGGPVGTDPVAPGALSVAGRSVGLPVRALQSAGGVPSACGPVVCPPQAHAQPARRAVVPRGRPVPSAASVRKSPQPAEQKPRAGKRPHQDRNADQHVEG